MAEFTLFETPIGRCAIAWNDRGIAGILLPSATDEATRAAVKVRFPGAREASPTAEVQRIVDAIVAMLRGESNDLREVPIDLAGLPPFARRVYEMARTIPPGQTRSYGEVAEHLGKPGSARAVGQALGRNPFAIVVPCHRVLAAGGRVGGFSAPGGVAAKVQLLELEGARQAKDPGSRAPEVAGEVAEAVEEIALAIDVDAALRHLRNADKALGRLIDRVGPFTMRVSRTQSLFAALARAIVYQQLTGKAAGTIFGRVKALFPGAAGGLTAEGLLGVSDDKLREAGLSRSKVLSLRDLARKMVDGHLPSIDEVHAMEDAAIVERLIEVRGIGRWTAEMLLMFRLGRPDILPVDDYGIRKGFAATFGRSDLPKREELEKRGTRWKPYRTVASWYLWRAAEREKRKAPAKPAKKKAPAKPAKKKAPAKPAKKTKKQAPEKLAKQKTRATDRNAKRRAPAQRGGVARAIRRTASSRRP